MKRYANVREAMIEGVSAFTDDVRARRYPEPEHGYTMAPDEIERLHALLGEAPASPSRAATACSAAPERGAATSGSGRDPRPPCKEEKPPCPDSRRLLPSPAMVVALVALVMSLGGSAYALVITGASIRNNRSPVRTSGSIRCAATTSRRLRRRRRDQGVHARPGSAASTDAGGLDPSAVLNGAGVLMRGGPGRGDPASKIDTGIYQVIFDRDVRPAPTWRPSATDRRRRAGPGQATGSMPGNVNGVRVRTETTATADKPFHLIVSC